MNVSAELTEIDRQLKWLDTLESAYEMRGSLRKFIRGAWETVEPAKPIIENWHIDAIADHLQAVAEGNIRFLLINIGPGYAKSLICSVLFSAWLWTRDPKIRVLAGTYATVLSERDNIKARSLIESEWYRSHFINTLAADKRWHLARRNENHLETSRMGFRMALSVDSVGTGLRGDGQILDDILNVKEAHSPAARRAARRWIFETMSSRFDDMRKGWRVAIGQRLHEQDPYGEMLASGMYEHLMLPTEYDPSRSRVTSIGFADPRQIQGELLFPELFTREVVDQAKSDLGSYGFAGQHQQNPTPAGGGIFKRWWFRYWKPKGMDLPAVNVMLEDGSTKAIYAVDLPEKFSEQGQSWDMAFKDLATSDYVAGGVWGRAGADKYLIDQRRGQLNFPATLEAVREVSRQYPGSHLKLIEDKANGTAVIATLKKEIPGLVAVNPQGGKIARAQAASPQIESGNVYLPHPAISPWVDGFIEEFVGFPNATHDDQVDQTTQILNRWTQVKQPNLRILSAVDLQ